MRQSRRLGGGLGLEYLDDWYLTVVDSATLSLRWGREMSLVLTDGNPVHYPKADKFVFDEEVTAIFENMAERSIPMYREAHKINVSLLLSVRNVGLKRFLDVGSSTGVFYKTLCQQLGLPITTRPDFVEAYAVDISKAMCDKLTKDLPWVQAKVEDISLPGQPLFRAGLKFDVISMMYLLQFVPVDKKMLVLEKVYDSLADDGVLFLGQKDNITGGIGHVFHDLYIQFRKDNGYSQEEIDAKTKALKNSQWCSEPGLLKDALYGLGFKVVQETSRWLNFSTFVCVK